MFGDKKAKAGLTVDSAGNPAVDPTQNVLDLVAASERRLDDLRLADERLNDAKHDFAAKLIEVHAAHAQELRETEAKRLNAIREVDVAAAALDKERAATAAAALAAQVATSASTLRELVATTASVAATAASSVTNPLAERISQLERTSYEGSGKSAVADPQMAKMAEMVEVLVRNMNKDERTVENRYENRLSTGVKITILMASMAFITLLVTLIVAFGR